MNELQISLIGIGVVVVGAIYVYNLWQEKRHKKVAERLFPEQREDVLMPGSTEVSESELALPDQPAVDAPYDRLEPALYASSDRPLEPVLTKQVHIDSEQDGGLTHCELPTDLVPVVPEQPVIDTNITLSATAVAADPAESPSWPDTPVPVHLYYSESDAVAKIELVNPMKASELLLMGLEAFSRVGKPVFWLGFDENSEQWVALSAETTGLFSHLQVVLQLADRQGPINLPELNLFLMTVQDIAVQLNAVLDTDDFETARHRAQDVDQFCAEVDLQIGINLVGISPFLGTKIRALAEAAGMVINWQGAFEKIDDDGRSLFVMSNMETMPFANETLKTLRTHGLTFVLDVPRTAEGGFTFDHMLRLIRQFADVLQAKMVDDNKHPLSDEQLANIRSQFVVATHNKMRAQGVIAGSPLALRLFS